MVVVEEEVMVGAAALDRMEVEVLLLPLSQMHPITVGVDMAEAVEVVTKAVVAVVTMVAEAVVDTAAKHMNFQCGLLPR